MASIIVVAALVEPAAAQESVGATNPLDVVRTEDLEAFRLRPLFSPTRRPPPPEPELPEVVTPEEPPPNLQLIGVVEVSGRSIAIANNLDLGTTVSLEANDTMGDWDVMAITRESLELGSGERTAAFRLFQPGRARQQQPEAQRAVETRPRTALSDASSDTLLKILRGEIKISDK